jgi:hypothetical protein
MQVRPSGHSALALQLAEAFSKHPAAASAGVPAEVAHPGSSQRQLALLPQLVESGSWLQGKFGSVVQIQVRQPVAP